MLAPIFLQAFVAPDPGFSGTPLVSPSGAPRGRDGGYKIEKKFRFTDITGKVRDISPANLYARVELAIPYNMTPYLQKSIQN